jgi:predicted metalloprotease with PDZ domain
VFFQVSSAAVYERLYAMRYSVAKERLFLMSSLLRSLAALIALLFIAPFQAIGQKPPIQIVANLTDAPRKLYHAEIDLPVTSGPLTLTTPKWIPGDHRPTGPVDSITGVVFTVNGQILPWRRDDVDLYEFHLTIPKGVATLHAHLDCIVTDRVSQKMAVLEWEKLLLYPAATPVREIPIQPSLKVPAGWGIGTALAPISSGAYPVPAAASTTLFAATNAEQLEDSPVITGQYFHEFPLERPMAHRLISTT